MPPTGPDTLTIAIDYDGTWTADPAAFRAIVETLHARGHHVIIATGRTEWSDDMHRGQIPATVPIHYTAGHPKRAALAAQGIHPHIWIDNEPGTIEPSRHLPDTDL